MRVAVCVAAAALAGLTLAATGDGEAAEAARAPLGIPAGCDNVGETGLVCNLTVSVTGPGKVTGTDIDCPSDCSAAVDLPGGTERSVTLTAQPNPGAIFVGWSGDCSGTSPTCMVTLPPGRSVEATFAVAPSGCTASGEQLSCSLTATVTGPGKVTGPGIDCPPDCSEQILVSQDSPRTITLTAEPGPGAVFGGWSGACTGTAVTCTVTLPAAKSVQAAFTQSPTAPSPPPTPAAGPVIGDSLAPPLPDSLPPPGRELEVDLSGNGTVVGRVAGNARSHPVARAAGGAVSIRCGAKAFRCEAKLPPGTVMTFEAKPARGSVFAGWRGACAGQGTTCRVVLQASRSVSAIFRPSDASSQVRVDLGDPAFRVRWRQSTGRGTLVLRGRASRAATLRVQVRRPGGGPLLSDQVSVRAGAFRLVLRLAPGLLPPGARVLPGGFIVTLTGTSGGLPVGFQLRTVLLQAPREGVVRTAFANDSETGGPKRLPAGATQAYAHFVFAAQPAGGQPLTVTWYRPDGSLLGRAEKGNRPSVWSFIKADTALPTGTWRAELEAGGRLVKVLRVRIG